MAIRTRFFASMREQQPNAASEVDVGSLAGPIHTVKDVWVAATGQELMPEQVLCSVNLEHREPGDTVHDGDEVAFFPQVTGG